MDTFEKKKRSIYIYTKKFRHLKRKKRVNTKQETPNSNITILSQIYLSFTHAMLQTYKVLKSVYYGYINFECGELFINL